MSGTLPEPVERVSAFLRESGAEARIQEFPEGTHTAQDAADAVGCELGQIVKSLVFVCDGRDCRGAWSPATDAATPDKIARGRRGETRRASRSRRRSRTRPASRREPCPPFPLPENTVVLMDRALLRHPLVWAGAGSAQHVLGMAAGGARARLPRAPTRRFG